MTYFSKFSKTDRRLIYLAIIGVLFSIYFLIFDSSRENIDRTNDIKIGFVDKIDNDTRKKAKGSYVWEDALKNEPVYIGDSIYSGKNSNVKVSLNDLGGVDIGENSLVTFESLNNENVLGLESGQFKLRVNGTMKVAVQGELMTIDGHQSELNIVLAKNKKPVIKIVKGDAKLKKDAPIIKMDQVIPTKPLYYTWRLYDQFIKVGDELFEKENLPSFITLPNFITWSHIAAKPAMIEWANNPNFKNKVSFQGPAKGFDLNKAFIGDNFWRISFDGGEWSKAQKFILNVSYLKNAIPKSDAYFYEIPYLDEKINITIPLRTNIETSSFLVQASANDKFTKETTKTFWSNAPNEVGLSFYRPGRFYYRFAALNKKLELSEWSKTFEFKVFKPDAPAAPTLTKTFLRVLSATSLVLLGSQMQTTHGLKF